MREYNFNRNKFFHKLIDKDSEEYILFCHLMRIENKKILILGDYDMDLKNFLCDNNTMHIDIYGVNVDSIVNDFNRGKLYYTGESYDLGDIDYDYIIDTKGIAVNVTSIYNVNIEFPIIAEVLMKRQAGKFTTIASCNIESGLSFKYSFLNI